jgi:hypothetical protein
VKALSRLASLSLALLVASPAAWSQALTCDDIEFDSIATDEFPSVARACHSVVNRDGKLYVRLVADVVRVRADGSVVLDFKTRDGSRIRQDFAPPPGFRATISGEPTPLRRLVRGQEIRLYLPADRWHVVERP